MKKILNAIFTFAIGINLLFIINVQAAKEIKTNTSNLTFIAISDLHFDPFQGCHFAKACSTIKELTKAPLLNWHNILSNNSMQQKKRLLLGMDTNQYLIDKFLIKLNKMAKQKKPSFIIITGDFIAHGIKNNYKNYFGTLKGYPAFIRKLFQYLHAKLQSASHEVPIYFVMGNNDGYLGDYIHNADGQFFKDIKEDWPLLSQSPYNQHSLLDSTGNYAITIKNDWRLIILNTNLFYKKTKGAQKDKFAQKSLRWLSNQLKIAGKTKQKVLFFYHIPYGVQPSKRFFSPTIASLWTPSINNTFFTLSMQYRDIIKGRIHGHLHRQTFVPLHKNIKQPLTQYLVSSISPIFGNAPTFSIFNFQNNKLDIKRINI